jgi:tRNA G18 (ribose-2'-O)-methylase SpoU
MEMNKTHSHGVGPHPQPWPTSDRYDKELLQSGDYRNVPDQYRYWTVEAIKAVLDESRVELEIAIENWQHDFNIGSIVRTANAFNVSMVHIIGRKQWNRRGAMVTDRYLTIRHHASVGEFVTDTRDRHKVIVAVDNVSGATNLSNTTLPLNSVLVFGGEGPGLSEEILDRSEQVIQIEQFGSTRSVNVGVAAGIVMYSWMSQHTLKN